MKTLWLLILTVFAFQANAYVVPIYRDLKPATQAMLEHQTMLGALLASTTYVHTAAATSASVATVLSTFAHQPDLPRNLTVTTGGTTADCKLATVVVVGTNFYGASISENFAITDNQNGTTTGVKAFKTVSTVTIPAQDGAGCTYAVGIGPALGLKSCMALAGYGVFSVFDGAYETTRATWVADATHVESNTITMNGTLNGAKIPEAFYVQNYT